MKQFLIGLATISAVVVIGLLGFALYENDAELREYKREVFGVRSDYKNLQDRFDDYIEQTKNLRNTVVLAKTPDSKNIQVADTINKYAANIKEDLSIYYKNLTTDESVIVDGDRKYYMASLYKVILTLFILEEIKKGTTTLDTKIGTSDETLETMLDKIITESNNEYAQALADHYTWQTIADDMRAKLGIEFNLNKNLEISVKNVGILFEDIALSLKVTNDQASFLLNLLKDQKTISKLPKYLPDSIYSHNKTGEFEEFSHDAGIFYTPKANYILVFMSKTKTPSETNEQMALMSKEVYEILNEVGK